MISVLKLMIKVAISSILLTFIGVGLGLSAGPNSRMRGEEADDTAGGGRGFVRFISQDELPWAEFRVKDNATGLKAKILSRDPNTGAVSLLLSYPPGWRSRANSNYHSGDEEIFVLEGDLTIGKRMLTDRCYSFIPAGMTHGPISTSNGCLALTFFSQEPDVIASSESRSDAKLGQSVEYKSYFDESWTLDDTRAQSKTPPPLLTKVLRQDEQTGARTWIAGVLSGHPNYTWEKDSTWEEGFLLEGEYSLAECVNGMSKLSAYSPGGYFFRPAGLTHMGPNAGAKGYAIWLFRTPGKPEVEFLEKTACK